LSLFSIKEELSVEKLKGAKLWITAGPREKFTASEVMYQQKKAAHFETRLWILGRRELATTLE